MFYLFACTNEKFIAIHKSSTVIASFVVGVLGSICFFIFMVWNWYLCLSGRTFIEFLNWINEETKENIRRKNKIRIKKGKKILKI